MTKADMTIRNDNMPNSFLILLRISNYSAEQSDLRWQQYPIYRQMVELQMGKMLVITVV